MRKSCVFPLYVMVAHSLDYHINSIHNNFEDKIQNLIMTSNLQKGGIAKKKKKF